jgi:hypothetical protein
MKHIHSIIFLLLFICINNTSCKNKKYENVNDLNYQIDIRIAIQHKEEDMHLTEFGENVRYIHLETKENNYLRRIQKVLLKDNYIFVTDRKSVFQFRENGKFIRQVGKEGKGPGEHSNRISFTLNPAKNEVLIFSSGSNHLNFYDIESGEFKDSKIIGFDFYDIELISDENIACLTYELNAGYSLNTLVEAYIINNKGIKVDSILNFERKDYVGNSAGFPIHYKYNNSLYYIYNYRDNVYKLTKDLGKEPYLHLEFNNVLCGNELVLIPDPSKIQFPDHLFVHSVLENEEYIFISVYAGFDLSFSGNNIHHLIYNKKNATVSHVRSIKWDCGLEFWPQWIENEKLISCFQPHEFLEHFGDIKNKETSNYNIDFITSLNKHDNPILVIVD